MLKFVALFFLLLGLFVLGKARAIPHNDDAAKPDTAKPDTAKPDTAKPDTASSQKTEPDPVATFMNTLSKHIPAILRIMEATRFGRREEQQAQKEVELNNNKYAATEVVHNDGTSAIGLLLSTIENLIKDSGNVNPELTLFTNHLSDYQILQFIRDMAVGAPVQDMIQLVMQSPSMQAIFKEAAQSLPFFKSMLDTVGKTNVQDRAIGDVLFGKMPSAKDFNEIVSTNKHYSLKDLISAVEKDRQFREAISMTLDKKIPIHELLRLFTSKPLTLKSDLDPKYQDKYAVTSTDLNQNNFLVNYVTAFDFLLANFSKLMRLVETFDTTSPDLLDIMRIVLTLDMSMLQAPPSGPSESLVKVQPMSHSSSPQLVHAATAGVKGPLIGSAKPTH